MSKNKKSWSEKLCESHGLPKVEKLNGKVAQRWGGETVVIPAPLEVDEIMKQVPRGKLTTITEIRQKLAKKHHTQVACPLTSGIFSRIAACAAEEQRAQGQKNFTPWWRTLKSGGLLNGKYPGGLENQKKFLESEGFIVIPKGKKNLMVKNYEKYLDQL